FKTFMAYKGAIGVDDTELISVMETAKSLGALVTAHCEHGDAVVALQKRLVREGKLAPRCHAESRPAPIEGEATNRAIMLARMTGAPIYIAQGPRRAALGATPGAGRRGQLLRGEPPPKYLLLDAWVNNKPNFGGAAYVMSPPIRPKGHQEALWAGVS